MDTTLSTFGCEVTEYANKKTMEEAKVCYHEIVRKPGDDTQFDLTQKFSVVAKVKEVTAQGACTPNSFGAFVPLNIWAPSDSEDAWLLVVWVCKWTANGLMPVRPLVILSNEITIPGSDSHSWKPFAKWHPAAP